MCACMLLALPTINSCAHTRPRTHAREPSLVFKQSPPCPPTRVVRMLTAPVRYSGWPVREYSWGKAPVLATASSDVLKLRDLLLVQGLDEFKNKTEASYHSFRCVRARACVRVCAYGTACVRLPMCVCACACCMCSGFPRSQQHPRAKTCERSCVWLCRHEQLEPRASKHRGAAR